MPRSYGIWYDSRCEYAYRANHRHADRAGRRKDAGLSQEQLGARLGVSGVAVHKWEQGINDVSRSRLVDIARVTGHSVDYFYPRSDMPDLAATLLALYPGLTPAAIQSIQTYAAFLASRRLGSRLVARATAIDVDKPLPAAGAPKHVHTVRQA